MTHTAFVAGATGYTGRHVVEACLGRRVRTIAHVRPDSSRREDWERRFREQGAEVDTTAWDPRAMAQSLARLRPTHVFSLLGTTRKRGAEDGGSYESVDYGLTMLLLEAALELPEPRPRFIYLSVLGAGSPGPKGRYMRARARCEARIRATDLDYFLVRPSLISGPDRDEQRGAERAAAVSLGAVLDFAGRVGARAIRDRYRPMSGRELGHSIVETALDSKVGRRFVDVRELAPLADELR